MIEHTPPLQMSEVAAPDDADYPTVKVAVYCGCYAGPANVMTDLGPEPGECGFSALLRVHADEWAEGCVGFACPSCGADLTQSDDDIRLA
jgi:hypothetical protein